MRSVIKPYPSVRLDKFMLRFKAIVWHHKKFINSLRLNTSVLQNNCLSVQRITLKLSSWKTAYARGFDCCKKGILQVENPLRRLNLIFHIRYKNASISLNYNMFTIKLLGLRNFLHFHTKWYFFEKKFVMKILS